MYTGIFDTHAHYDDEQFDGDREQLLTSLQNSGIKNIINCATEISTCEISKDLAESYSYIYFAAGIHPEDCENLFDNYKDRLSEYFSHKKCVAIGEIGLDYHYDTISRDLQLKIFEEQLQLSKDFDLPVIIHDREAHQDTLELLKKYKPKGVLHCFSGSVEMSEEIIKLGMFIGLGGSVTFKNAKKPVAVAKNVPIDRIVLETDCPYMAPSPFRGRRNDSRLIAYTAEFISQLRNCDTQDFINKTAENASILFGIDY